jgi:AraC-like DNA-binding protein
VPIRSARKLLSHAEIRCGEKTTSLIFPADCLDEALEQDPPTESIALRRHDRARSSRNEGELVYILRRTLGAYLPDGSMNIKLAARLCGVSVRTLQRRLSERGTSYSELLEGIRYATAVRLLEDSKKRVTDIGRELGYRDPAIFTRAFRRWTGVTPSEYRRRRKR